MLVKMFLVKQLTSGSEIKPIDSLYRTSDIGQAQCYPLNLFVFIECYGTRMDIHMGSTDNLSDLVVSAFP